jgi:PII-like signaling protein
MRLHGPALRLTIFIGESDHYHHHPLYTEIVHRAHKVGLAGVTVLRGIEGYGASTHIHTTRVLSLNEELPLVIVIVDDAERVRAFLPQLDEIVAEGLVIIDDVEVVKYVGRGHESVEGAHPGTDESAG